MALSALRAGLRRLAVSGSSPPQVCTRNHILQMNLHPTHTAQGIQVLSFHRNIHTCIRLHLSCYRTGNSAPLITQGCALHHLLCLCSSIPVLYLLLENKEGFIYNPSSCTSSVLRTPDTNMAAATGSLRLHCQTE